MDRNSSKNQDIKQKFVGQHVMCNVGTMIEYILNSGFEDRNAPFTIDDVENCYSKNTEKAIEDLLYEFDANNEQMSEYANDPDTYNRKVKTKSDFEVFLRSLDESELEETANEFGVYIEDEAQEVFEWWAVSEWLHSKLKDRGCVVLDAGSCHVWGRCTTGQAILLDGVISDICEEMGILEGQENAWA